MICHLICKTIEFKGQGKALRASAWKEGGGGCSSNGVVPFYHTPILATSWSIELRLLINNKWTSAGTGPRTSR